MKRSSFAAVAALAVTLLTGLLYGAALAPPALAHDALKSSDPAKNAEVESVTEVRLEFTARVRVPVVIVRGADNAKFESGKPQVDGTQVTQAVDGPLPPGRYRIAYRVVSSDGHPIEGEIPFTVVAKEPAAGATPSDEPSPAASASDAGTGEAAPGPATETAARTPTSAATAPVADERDAPRIPVWTWIAVGGITGVGIGMFYSMRNKKKR
jgi:methionine-rich copper-binding protein CopC